VFSTLTGSIRTLGIYLGILVLASCTSIESDPGRRTLGATIDDQSIEHTVSDNIKTADPALEEVNINVTSYNGIVLLSGQAPSEELRQLAAQKAAVVKNVRRVHNELTVGFSASFAAHSNDALITTKVKSKLLAAKDIKDSRVKVITENGVVFLMGMVSHAEGDIAARTAQETGGVQKVVRIFEYVDE